MKRRAFLALCAVAALGAASAVEAQTLNRVRRVVWFDVGSGHAALERVLREALKARGWVEGENLTLEFVYAHGNATRLPELAQELVARNVDVIVATGTTTIRAARDATATIPIVMAGGGDPVGTGLVASLRRPGGNVTGVSLVGHELLEKNLQLVQHVTGARTVALIRAAANPANRFFFEWAEAAGRRLGVRIVVADIGSAAEIETSLKAIGADAAVMLQDPFFAIHRDQIAKTLLNRRLPAAAPGRHYVEAGFLMGYGIDLISIVRLSGAFVDRIFRGANPADLPVEQPTKFDFVVNAKTAKALGLAIPPSLLLRADKVIE